MTRGIHLLGFMALAMLAAFVVFLGSSDTQAAPPQFNPGGMICFENLDTPAACDGDTTPGASPDIRSRFCVGWGADCTVQPVIANVKDSNFGAVAALLPTSFVPASAASAPVGSIAGYLTSTATLGLINGACSSSIDVAFSLMVASIDQANPISPKAVGQPDPFTPLGVDVNPANGIPDGADKYPAFLSEFFKNLQPRARLFGISRIQNSWIPLNFLFFEPGAHVVTNAADITFDANLGIPSITILGNPSASASPSAISDFCAPLISANVTLGQSMNNPCTPTPQPGGNCPGPVVVQNQGYPFLPCESVNKLDEDGDTVINDGCPQVGSIIEEGAQCANATSDDGEDSSPNDGCPPSGAVSEGSRIPGTCTGTDEGGCIIRQNPAAGAHGFTIVAGSQRDADSDGIENSLDVCALVENGGWNPRSNDTANDTDSDGLPNVCDPEPGTPADQSPLTCPTGIVGNDQDQDCFANRGDNCPNDSQLKDPNAAPSDPDNLPDIKDSDFDGIGDACDPSVDLANGDNIGYCIQFPLVVGSPPAPVVGTKEAEEAPACAATTFVAAPTAPPGQGVTTAAPATATPVGQTPVGGGGGVGGAGANGVGSLAPTAAGIPIWAAVMAALGGVGLLVGAGMLSFGHAKRRID